MFLDTDKEPNEAVSAAFESFLLLCSEQQLVAMLHAVQLLLGTPAERPGDLERARAIGHRLNNLATTTALMADLRGLEGTVSA